MDFYVPYPSLGFVRFPNGDLAVCGEQAKRLLSSLSAVRFEDVEDSNDTWDSFEDVDFSYLLRTNLEPCFDPIPAIVQILCAEAALRNIQPKEIDGVRNQLEAYRTKPHDHCLAISNSSEHSDAVIAKLLIVKLEYINKRLDKRNILSMLESDY